MIQRLKRPDGQQTWGRWSQLERGRAKTDKGHMRENEESTSSKRACTKVTAESAYKNAAVLNEKPEDVGD